MHGFPEYLLTFETGNSCSQLRYSLQIFESPRAPRGEGPRQCPQDISTSHCVPRVKINPADGWGERCAAPSSKSENLAWTPSHRYHWHVATPAVSAKKGPTSHASLRLLFSGRTHTATPRHQGNPRVKLLTKGGPAPCITAAACLPSRCCWAPNSEGPAPRRAGGPGEGTNIVETSA